MSTFGAIYKSMAGLLGFTRSLDNLSNNVANVNTPGFKGKDVFFQDLQDMSRENGGLGRGVAPSGEATRFEQGDIRETGNTTDLAIEGEGFFILRNGSEQYLTRAGQFVFADGYLVDQANGYRVAGISESGRLVDISLDGLSSQAPVATSLVQIAGNLSSLSPNDTVFPAAADDPITFSIVDGLGGNREISLRFTRTASDQWEARLRDEDGNPVGAAHTVRFLPDGAIDAATAEFAVDYVPYRALSGSELEAAVSAVDPVVVVGGVDTIAPLTIPIASGAVLATLDQGEVQFGSAANVRFDDTGALLDADTGLAVAQRTVTGEIIPFSIDTLLTSPAEATSNVVLEGVLDASAANGDTFPADPAATPLTLSTFTADGAAEDLSAVFTKVSATRWSLQLFDSLGAPIGASRNIDFNAAGVIDPADELVSFTYTPPGGASQTIDLRLGPTATSTGLSQAAGATAAVSVTDVDGRPEGVINEISFNEAGRIQVGYDNGERATGPQLALVESSPAGAINFTIDFSAGSGSDGLTGFSVPSDVQVIDVNGSEPGFLSSLRFTPSGAMTLVYSNGEEVDGPVVALGLVADKTALTSIGANLFRSRDAVTVTRSGERGAGQLVAESIELSNVELSREFAEIIIVQRGYQASSQVLNVTNEMLQNLYDSTGGR